MKINLLRYLESAHSMCLKAEYEINTEEKDLKIALLEGFLMAGCEMFDEDVMLSQIKHEGKGKKKEK